MTGSSSFSRIATGGWTQADFEEMYRDAQERFARNPDRPDGIANVGQANYVRKFSADFSKEMTRSVQAILRVWEAA